MAPVDMSVFKRKPNNLAFLLHFGDTCALSILISENESCQCKRSVHWKYHGKKDHFLHWGLQAQVERGGQMLEMRQAGMWGPGGAESLSLPWNDFPAPADCPQAKMQTRTGRSSPVSERREEIGPSRWIFSFKILPVTPPLFKVLYGPDKTPP